VRASPGVRPGLAALVRVAAATVVAALLATACGSGTIDKPGDDPVLRGPATTARSPAGRGY
jgi:hypothetical protein